MLSPSLGGTLDIRVLISQLRDQGVGVGTVGDGVLDAVGVFVAVADAVAVLVAVGVMIVK